LNTSIFTADGIKIGYSKDKQVGSSGWSTIYVFFDELVNVLVGIIENPKVQNVDKSLIHQLAIVAYSIDLRVIRNFSGDLNLPVLSLWF
jgi:hypothetical protein